MKLFGLLRTVMRDAYKWFLLKSIHFLLLSHLFCSFTSSRILIVVFRMATTRPPPYVMNSSFKIFCCRFTSHA